MALRTCTVGLKASIVALLLSKAMFLHLWECHQSGLLFLGSLPSLLRVGGAGKPSSESNVHKCVPPKRANFSGMPYELTAFRLMVLWKSRGARNPARSLI